MFDASVNHGTGRAAKFLHKAVGANMDGSIGPLTLANLVLSNPQKSSTAWLSIATRSIGRWKHLGHSAMAGLGEMTKSEKPLCN